VDDVGNTVGESGDRPVDNPGITIWILIIRVSDLRRCSPQPGERRNFLRVSDW